MTYDPLKTKPKYTIHPDYWRAAMPPGLPTQRGEDNDATLERWADYPSAEQREMLKKAREAK